MNVAKPPEPTPQPQKLPPVLPARRYVRSTEDVLRYVASDDPLKTEVRLRVHADCARLGERVLGKFGPSPAATCPRCKRPASAGVVVVAGKRTTLPKRWC